MTPDTLPLIACAASTAAVLWWSAPKLGRALLLKGLKPQRLDHPSNPEALGIQTAQVRHVWMPVGQGRQLHALWLHPDATQPGPRPLVIAMHGWGANGATLLPLAPPLLEMGVSVLLPDARCHGLSDGERFTSLLRFAEDIEAAMRWAQTQPELDPQRVALAGHSVGAGAALLVAARRPDVHAVLSLSAFAHPREVMQRWMAAMHIPQRLLGAWILGQVQAVIGARFEDIAPLRSASVLRCPVLFVHGEQDQTVPASDAQRLRNVVPHPDADTLLIPGGHDLNQGLDAHHAFRIHGFIQRVFARETPPHSDVTRACTPHP